MNELTLMVSRLQEREQWRLSDPSVCCIVLCCVPWICAVVCILRSARFQENFYCFIFFKIYIQNKQEKKSYSLNKLNELKTELRNMIGTFWRISWHIDSSRLSIPDMSSPFAMLDAFSASDWPLMKPVCVWWWWVSEKRSFFIVLQHADCFALAKCTVYSNTHSELMSLTLLCLIKLELFCSELLINSSIQVSLLLRTSISFWTITSRSASAGLSSP